MAKLTPIQGVALAAVTGGLAAVLILYGHADHNRAPLHIASQAQLPTKPKELESYIDANRADPRPEMQNKVGNARIRLAYTQVHARNGKPQPADYEAARKTLLTAVKEYKGKGEMSGDFGGVPDAAAYQAAACLMGEGKNAEAKKELTGFLKDRPLSPLCQGAYKRLVRLNGGKPSGELDGLFQQDVTAQEKHIAFETSVCGPKAIAYLLPLVGKPTKDYKELARLCRTTDKGTSLAGMRKGLAKLGLTSVGLQLARGDVESLETPALLLRQNHYLVILGITSRAMRVYDPTTEQTDTINLPAASDPNFCVTVLAISPAGDKALPDVSLNS